VQIKLPDDLIPDIRSRAARAGRAVDETVAELLRAALGHDRVLTPADRSMLERRAVVGEKFISGEWGVDLNGFNEGRTAERDAAAGRDRAWRR
jgi:plasmid stability protein